MKKHLNDRLTSILCIIFGNIVYALSVKLFVLPSGMMSSGTTGISLIIHHLTGFPISTFVLLFNVAMLLVALCFLGRGFVMTTIASSLLYPIFLEIANQLLGDFVFTQNMMLNTLFAGLGLGFALGVILRSGASTGGMDIPLLILNRYFHIPVSLSLYAFDFCIILGQSFYHQPEDVLYGVLLLLLTSLVLDKTMLIGTTKTEIKVVSPHAQEITREILTGMDRGVTLLHGEGGYQHREQQVVLSVVSNRELPQVLSLIRCIDPESFVIVSRVSEVWGRGFSIKKEYIQ